MAVEHHKVLKILAEFILGIFLFCFFTFPTPGFAAHPLVTDDAGTVGKGVFQLEVGGEISRHETDQDGDKIKERGGELSTALSYGIVEEVDLMVTFPYVWSKVEENGSTIYRENGFSDVSFTAKWRFFEKYGIGLALKPGITLPTGDHKRELGSGRATYSVTFIATKESEPFTFHINSGYARSENKLEERKNLWSASIAGEIKVGKAVKIVGEAGVSQNPDYESGTDPAFAAVGIIYALTEKVDIDIGYRAGLNEAEPDHTLLAGVTARF